MMGMLRAEMLKYKRTFMAKLVIFIPLFFAAYSLVTSYLVPGSYDWNGILVMSFNWWPVTFLPLGYGLFAGMVASLERKAGNYRVLKGEVLSPRRIWLGKILGMALIAACSSAVLVLGDLVCGMLQGGCAAARGDAAGGAALLACDAGADPASAVAGDVGGNACEHCPCGGGDDRGCAFGADEALDLLPVELGVAADVSDDWCASERDCAFCRRSASGCGGDSCGNSGVVCGVCGAVDGDGAVV